MTRESTLVVRLIAGVTIAATAAVGFASVARAHDGIASSDPASGSVVEQPIDVVTIDFGAEIGPETELALIDPNDEELASTTTVTSATTAMIEFDPLDEKGAYIVRYLAPSVTDGHLIVGAISFTYGSPSGASVVPWVLFGVAALVILGIGFWFSRRAQKRKSGSDESDQGASSEEAPATVGDPPA